MRNVVFAVASFLIGHGALANQYHIYQLNCRLSGTVQDIESPAARLKRTLNFTAQFAQTTKDDGIIPQSYRLKILSQRGQRMATPTLKASGSITSCLNGNAPRVEIELGEIDAAVVQQYFVEMGEENIPDLTRALSNTDNSGKISFSPLWLGATQCAYDEVASVLRSGTLTQVHFDYAQYKGLSYHLTLDSCSVRYLDPNAPVNRRGD